MITPTSYEFNRRYAIVMYVLCNTCHSRYFFWFNKTIPCMCISIFIIVIVDTHVIFILWLVLTLNQNLDLLILFLIVVFILFQKNMSFPMTYIMLVEFCLDESKYWTSMSFFFKAHHIVNVVFRAWNYCNSVWLTILNDENVYNNIYPIPHFSYKYMYWRYTILSFHRIRILY